ncbi:MAG: trimethylamine methyltransferase family protein [Anaerolineae bacterium]
MRLQPDGRVLADDELGAVLDAAIAILARDGVRVEHPLLLERLGVHGGQVDAARQVVRFPEQVTADFIAVSQRQPPAVKPVSYAGTAEIYQGWYLDPATGAYEPWTEARLLEYIRLARACPQLGGAAMLGMPACDWPTALQPLTEKLFCWQWGLQGGGAIWDTHLCPAILAMWRAWAEATGSDLARAFNGTVYLISPLRLGAVEAEQYVWFAQRGLEVQVGTLGSVGGSAPVTLAGALALGTAEGLFLNMLRRAWWGHRDLKMGNAFGVIDMASGCFRYGRPEQTLLNLAAIQMARRLGAHGGAHAGLTDAVEPGFEAAAQKVASALYAAQAGGHGHIACGLLAVDEVFSPEQMVLDAEILGWLQRLERGLEVNAATLALDTIADVGWGGEFLSREHTALHLRSHQWQPGLFLRDNYSRWAAGRRLSERQRAREHVRDLLRSAPPLEPRITPVLGKRLWEIIRAEASL